MSIIFLVIGVVTIVSVIIIKKTPIIQKQKKSY